MAARNANTGGAVAGRLMTMYTPEIVAMWKKYPRPAEFYLSDMATEIGMSVQKTKKFAVAGIIEVSRIENKNTSEARKVWRFAPWVGGWLDFYGAI
jgi:hypothetical protein